MEYTGQDHTFAVCAYGESRYLAECIRSLERQTVRSRIILCSSTPNEALTKLSTETGLELYIRKGQPGIAPDWNFALAKAATPLVTLAHQDDIYEPTFLEETLRRISAEKKPLIAFTDYFELRGDRRVYAGGNRNLRIKECMLLPLRSPLLARRRFVRRRILSLGSPVCCPSVTYVKKALPEQIFSAGFEADLDWQAWERLSRLSGSFCYIPKALMGHRIHEESATTRVIGAHRNRSREDLEMFRIFWPEGIARLLNHYYAAGQDQNKLRDEEHPL